MALPLRQLLLVIAIVMGRHRVAAELRLAGLYPPHGRAAGGETIIVALAGVEQADWDGFDSGFFLIWPTGEHSGFYQVLGGRPASAPASGLLNLTAISRPMPSDWNGPFLMDLWSEYWVDGWIYNRHAACPNATRCTFFYDA